MLLNYRHRQREQQPQAEGKEEGESLGMEGGWLIERVEALLRGAPLPRQRRQWEQVRGRLIRP
jgi:hypothetical protein